MDNVRKQLVERWNERKTELEKLEVPTNVRELVEGAATRYGDRQAWNFFESGETVTFQEAAKMARKAAGALAAIGVHKGSVVAVMLPNSPLYLATWLGLGYLGAVIAPVNGRYTTGEVEHVLKVSGASKLIVGQRYEELLSKIDSAILPDRDLIDGVGTGPDSWASRVATANESFVPVDEPVADDPVSIQFTSGTTGFPKGCTLTHRSWLHSAVAFAGYVDEPIERFLCNQNLFYLDGQFITLVNLTRGTTTYYCAAPSVSKFDGWLRQYRIQGAFYFDPLFAAEPQGEPEEYDLRVIHIFGFSRKRHQELQDRYPNSVVRESYGMTEYAPALLMPMDADALNGSGSCGLPAPHTELRIVDENGQDVPLGAEGELVVRGPGMMLGYYNDPAATEETVRGGWLHTGDLFRQDEHGFYYIVGRKKDMIRRNAENIACMEVESVLRLHPGIREAAVVPVPDDVVGEEVKAYILPADGPLDAREVLDFCALHLAKFKVPRYVSFVDEFVMTESARVEKKKLVQGVEDLTVDAFDALTATGGPRVNPSTPENLDDFPAIVGSRYTGDWLRLSPERIQGFWIGTYLDKAYGDSLGPEYPAGLVEGFYQLALLDHMSTEILGRWHGYNYGLDRVRFLSPLTDDKAVRLVLTVAEANPKPKGLLVTYDVVLEADGQSKPTMAARWLVLLQDLQPIHNKP